MMIRPQQFPLARSSAGPAPLRRAGSIRRTTSIDSDWPEGLGSPWRMIGRARDFLTCFDGETQTLATGGFQIRASPQREILDIAISPDHAGCRQLVGVRAGGASREALRAKLGEICGSPTYQLLDDFAGASLVATWIWSRWRSDWLAASGRTKEHSKRDRQAAMENICIGFATGGSAMEAIVRPDIANQSNTEVGPLENPEDLLGWHPMPVQTGPQMRRARRIDVWRDGDTILVDAAFQDSGSNPYGGRTALHEYRIYVEIDADTGVLASLQALPMILPFRECPGATIKATRMVGIPVAEFRQSVLDRLPGALGCTHLNDVLRALADVPVLARQLP